MNGLFTGGPALFAAVLTGVALALALHLARFVRPWRFGAPRDAGAVTRAAHAALRGAAAAEEWALAEELYERWINLPRAACSAAAEALRRDGIDMIRLGDALHARRRRA